MHIGQILRLTRWEWFKLRRLRMPWVLLSVAVLVSQLSVWSNYLAYHNDTVQQIVTGTFSSYGVSFEDEGRKISVTMTCADAVKGRVPTGFDQLPEGHQQQFLKEVDEWLARGECDSYQSVEELRKGFALPSSVTGSIAGFSSLGPIAIGPLLIMFLAASLFGGEYGWGTLRTVLAGGIGRWQLLSAKLILLLRLCSSALIVIALAAVVSSLTAALLPPEETDGLSDSGRWFDVVTIYFRTLYGMLPFMALSAFAAVLTSSRGVGIALSVGYFIAESILAPLLHLNDTLSNVADYLLIQSFRSWTTAPLAEDSSNAFQDFAVILAYTVLLIAAALWMFRRRDIGGAMGD